MHQVGIVPRIHVDQRKLDTQTFLKYFPGSQITTLTYDEVPSEALETFEHWSQSEISPKVFKKQNFHFLGVISHLNGDITYISHQDKTYQEGYSYYSDSKITTAEFTYLYEVNAKGFYTGYGKIAKRLSACNEDLRGRPFVNYTYTTSPQSEGLKTLEFRGKGLGTRRLFMMNALSMSLYDTPLHSSSLIHTKALRLWMKLEQEGKAELQILDDMNTYRFIPEAIVN